jgi:hypothetical protein
MSLLINCYAMSSRFLVECFLVDNHADNLLIFCFLFFLIYLFIDPLSMLDRENKIVSRVHTLSCVNRPKKSSRK